MSITPFSFASPPDSADTGNTRRFYAFVFFAAWCFMYLIFPTWVLPLTVTQRGFVFFGLLVYIGASCGLLYRWLAPFDFDSGDLDSGLVQTAWHQWSPNEIGWFAGMATVAVALHLYPILMPVTMGFDEAEHLHGGLAFYIRIHRAWYQRFPQVPLQLVVWGLTLVMGGILFWGRRALILAFKRVRQLKVWQPGWPFWGLILMVVLILGLYFWSGRNLVYHGALVRFPPLGKVFNALIHLFGGPSPVGPRLLQVAFYIGGAGLFWHLVAHYRDPLYARTATLVYLFSPLIFYQARIAELACGTLFFQLLLSFLFLRYYENRRASDLVWLVFWFVVAFLFKRTNLFMLGVMGGFLLPGWIRANGPTRGALVRLMGVGLLGVIPFLVIGKFFSWRNYDPVLSNVVTLSGWMAFMELLPHQMSWPYFGLWLLSLPYLFIFRRDRLVRYLGWYCLVFYTLYTLDFHITHRFAISFYPLICLATALLVVDVGHWLAGRRGALMGSLVLGVYLVGISTFWPAAPLLDRFVTYDKFENHFFPIEQAMQWAQSNAVPPHRILMLGLTGSAFYRDVYAIEKSSIQAFSNNFKEVETPAMLADYCRRHQIAYLMFGVGPGHEKLVNTPILTYLSQNPDRSYKELKRYVRGENTIYIYQVRRS